MAKYLITYIFFAFCFKSFSQTGTISSPYTSLQQAYYVTTAGTYYFNVGGNAFSTYVEPGGWVLVASGAGTITGVPSLSVTSNLIQSSNAILPLSIYTDLSIIEVRFNATFGPNLPFDVTTTDALVINNLQNNRTLSVGISNGIWSGISTSRMDILGCASTIVNLPAGLYHACGNTSGFHWIYPNYEQIVWTNPNNQLNFWVRTTSVGLPIELLYLNVQCNQDKLIFDWATATEHNNKLFVIEVSSDAINWQDVYFRSGAGNSSQTILYSANLSGNNKYNYFRLKQIDYDGTVTFSKIIYNECETNEEQMISMFPNPTTEELNFIIKGYNNQKIELIITNEIGQTVYQEQLFINDNTYSVKHLLNNYSKGIYFISTECNNKITNYKIVKY